MRTILTLSTLLLALALIPTAAAAEGPTEASLSTPAEACAAPATSPPAEDAPAPLLNLDGPEAQPMADCVLCPPREVFCFQDSDCSAACPCGGRCVSPFLQICVYRSTTQFQAHCECNTG